MTVKYRALQKKFCNMLVTYVATCDHSQITVEAYTLYALIALQPHDPLEHYMQYGFMWEAVSAHDNCK